VSIALSLHLQVVFPGIALAVVETVVQASFGDSCLAAVAAVLVAAVLSQRL